MEYVQKTSPTVEVGKKNRCRARLGVTDLHIINLSEIFCVLRCFGALMAVCAFARSHLSTGQSNSHIIIIGHTRHSMGARKMQHKRRDDKTRLRIECTTQRDARIGFWCCVYRNAFGKQLQHSVWYVCVGFLLSGPGLAGVGSVGICDVAARRRSH